MKKQQSKQQLVDAFNKAYDQKFARDKQGPLGFFRHSNLKPFQRNNLFLILWHGLGEGGERSISVFQQLQWLDKQCQLINQNPYLNEALQRVANRSKAVQEAKALLAGDTILDCTY